MRKKILITGATGFIGSHLTEICIKQNYNVVAFDRYNSNNNWGWLEHSKYKKNLEVILGDIRDFDSVFKAMKDCDSVFHLAALVGIPYSYHSPLAYIKTNLEGTYNVLEASKNLNLNQIIVTSTSEVFGTAQYSPIDEKHPLSAQSPYAASKIAADQLALSYFRSFKLPVKIIRPFNTYGPRQSARALIPSVIIQSLEKNKIIKLGNLSPTRDFTFVDDVCRAYLAVLKCDKLFGEVINVGTKKEISVKDLTHKIFGMIDKKQIKVREDKQRTRPKKSEVNRLICDNKKIFSQTKWKPKFNLKQGLTETIKWFRKSKHLYKSEFYNI